MICDFAMQIIDNDLTQNPWNLRAICEASGTVDYGCSTMQITAVNKGTANEAISTNSNVVWPQCAGSVEVNDKKIHGMSIAAENSTIRKTQCTDYAQPPILRLFY